MDTSTVLSKSRAEADLPDVKTSVDPKAEPMEKLLSMDSD